MGTLQDELKEKILQEKPEGRVPRRVVITPEVKQEYDETVAGLSRISKHHPKFKMKTRKLRRGKVTIMSKMGVAALNKEREVKGILEKVGELKPVLFPVLYKALHPGEYDRKKAKRIQNILQQIRKATKGIVYTGKNGWDIDQDLQKELGVDDILTMWVINRGNVEGNQKKIVKREPKEKPPVIIQKKPVSGKTGEKKTATITFAEDKVIIEREDCVVEIVPSNYNFLKIVL